MRACYRSVTDGMILQQRDVGVSGVGLTCVFEKRLLERGALPSTQSGAPRLYSRGPFGFFGETRRSRSSFAKASEDTRSAFLPSFIHPP